MRRSGMRAALRVLLALSLPAAGERTEDDARKDLERLQGEWVMVSCERCGNKLSDQEVATYSRFIEGNKYTVTYEAADGFHKLQGTIALDPTKSPRAIDAVRSEGESKGKPMPGIYALDGNIQKVCSAPVGQERPTDFSAPAGTSHVLAVWKRVRPRRAGERKKGGGPDPSDGERPTSGPEATTADALRRIGDDGNRQAITAFQRGDMLAVARTSADDATNYYPRGQCVRGGRAIHRYWQGVKGGKVWKLDTIEIGGTEEASYEVGKSTLTTEVEGKTNVCVCDYVVIWKRQGDGRYRAQTDAFN
jgi:uncharacterized protein (TIGR03067 family)